MVSLRRRGCSPASQCLRGDAAVAQCSLDEPAASRSAAVLMSKAQPREKADLSCKEQWSVSGIYAGLNLQYVQHLFESGQLM